MALLLLLTTEGTLLPDTCAEARGTKELMQYSAFNKGRGEKSCQISRQLAQEGGKVVSPTHWPPLRPGNIPGTHFCYRLSRSQGHSVTGRIMSMIKSNDIIRNQTHDLLACSAVPQTTAPLHAPTFSKYTDNMLATVLCERYV